MSGAADAPTGEANPLRTAPLDGIRRLSAKDSVRARIAMAVDLGLLAPGEQLPTVVAIASALGVSEVTVRRALESLATDGVLRGRRGRNGGTFVADAPARNVVAEVSAYTADSTTVHRLIDQRLLLECGAAHLAALCASANQCDTMDALVRDMDAAATWAEFRELDSAFHHLVGAASGVQHAEGELAAVLDRLHRYFLPYRMDVLRQSNVEHRELAAAVRRGAPTDAVRVTYRHVTALRRTMFVGLAG